MPPWSSPPKPKFNYGNAKKNLEAGMVGAAAGDIDAQIGRWRNS